MAKVTLPEIRNYRRVTSFRLVARTRNKDHVVVSRKDGPFIPDKVELIEYGDRTCIRVTGSGAQNFGRHWPATALFRVKGYPQYPPPPDWLLTVLRKTGIRIQVEELFKHDQT